MDGWGPKGAGSMVREGRPGRTGVPLWSLTAALGLAALPGTAVAATPVPALSIGVGAAHGPAQVAVSVQILLALTVLSLAPAILLLMTSFTRIVVVLSFARSALATGTLPPNQILVGLALFLTLFVMAPTFRQIYTQAWQPYQAGRLKLPVALARAEEPLRTFMLRQTAPADLKMFEQLRRREAQAASGGTAAGGGTAAATAAVRGGSTPAGTAGAVVPLTELVPAFVVGELRIAFEMGFVLYVPFVIIDLVVSSTLMAMGMLMLPPTLISTPFKVLLFVLVNGWTLLAQSLVLSFH